MRRTLYVTATAIGVLALAGLLASAAGMSIPNSVWGTSFDLIPYGSSMDLEALDSILGEEWADVRPVTVRLGTYAADIYVKQDGTYLYVGVALHTSRRLGKIIEAYVYFDDANFRPYTRGDDLMMIRSGGESATDADYYYVEESEIKFDRRGGGHSDAVAIGRFNEPVGAYVFEFRKTMDSGDVRDLALLNGQSTSMVFGIEFDD